ncbi:MAG: membrane integrity-associated transporter subunit PqiC, partial [Burkholderiales bacterium]|nr:membrane integrity-associated transporter subunit PqiC [Burkholderiales bacterium]
MNRLVIVAALLAASCSLGGDLKESFYVLSGPEGAPPAASGDALVIFVGPVAVPESVDRSQMVLQNSANQVDLPEEHRWAEPLKTAIPRVVAEHLTRLLGTPRVMSSRLGTSVDLDYRVALEVQRFESSLRDGAAVDVLWTLTGKRVPGGRSGRSSVREATSVPTPQGVAAAHSRALAR